MKKNNFQENFLKLLIVLCFLMLAVLIIPVSADTVKETPESPGETSGDLRGKPDLSRWNSLSDEQKQMVLKNFETWQKLSADDKKQTLQNFETYKRLPGEKRMQIAQNYKHWEKMPPEKREKLMKNYKKWQKMTPAQKKNAIKRYKSNRQKQSRN